MLCEVRSLNWFLFYEYELVSVRLKRLSLLLLWCITYQHAAAAAAKSLQSCPTLCEPIDGSPPGSAIPGILQARIVEWVAISFSNAWKWNVKVKLLSRVRLFATPWTAAHQAPLPMGFSGQEYWSGVPLPFPHISMSVSLFCWSVLCPYHALIFKKILILERTFFKRVLTCLGHLKFSNQLSEVPHFPNKVWGSWVGLHWACELIWRKLIVYNIESSSKIS